MLHRVPRRNQYPRKITGDTDRHNCYQQMGVVHLGFAAGPVVGSSACHCTHCHPAPQPRNSRFGIREIAAQRASARTTKRPGGLPIRQRTGQIRLALDSSPLFRGASRKSTRALGGVPLFFFCCPLNVSEEYAKIWDGLFSVGDRYPLSRITADGL